MIVYGDPQFSAPADRLVLRLQATLDSLRLDDDPLDDLRAFLIQAGQLEQGIFDRWEHKSSRHQPILRQSALLTDLAARALCRRFLSRRDRDDQSPGEIGGALSKLGAMLKQDRSEISIKVPEGFEFYALYPEQYCAAAIDWAEAQRASSRQALIVGIRSIGSTLSAVVAAALETRGWKTRRFTVRPAGHPFSRSVQLPEFTVDAAPHALVVDEGPGISGTSMAAAADALNARGITAVSFFPGHNGDPGHAASDVVRARWANTPRHLAPLAGIRWHNTSLEDSLRQKAAELTSARHEFEIIEDLSGGAWRRLAFSSESEWPAVARQFERMKFRCSNGNGTSVLWKFIGLGAMCEPERTSAESTLARMTLLANEGMTAPPLGVFLGFIAMPWISGRRLTRHDARDPAVLQRIGRYLARTAGPPLSPAESDAAISRLARMLRWNAREIVGEEIAEEVSHFETAARKAGAPFTYADGRLAPHEWMAPDAPSTDRLIKSDCCGHARDHTIIGEQSALWDLAGAMVEWDLESDAAAPLIVELEAAGIQIDPAALFFHELAYAAFRAGLCALALSQTSDPAEQHRLQSSRNRYSTTLSMLRKTSQAPRRTS